MKYLAIISLLLLTSCAQPLKVQVAPSPLNVSPPAEVRAPALAETKSILVTKENLEEFLKSQKDNVVFFALTPEVMEALMNNLSEIKRLVEQQGAVIFYYQNFIDEYNKKITTTK